MFKVDVVTASPFSQTGMEKSCMPINEEGQYLSKTTTIMAIFTNWHGWD